MPAVQTVYGTTHAAAFAGMVANSETFNSITRVCETVAGIGFGVPAVRGTADNQCAVAAAASLPYGVTIADPSQPGDLYARYANVAILTQGVIWVVTGENVTDGAPVYYVPATGVWVTTAGANILLPDAVWDTTALLGALAKIRIR